MKFYESAIRAAEESRTHRAKSRYRVRVLHRGKPVLAQILYEKGDYKLTFAGLMLTKVEGTPYFDIIDRVKEWVPV